MKGKFSNRSEIQNITYVMDYSMECDVKDGGDWSVIGDADLSAIVQEKLHGRVARTRRVFPRELKRCDYLTLCNRIIRNRTVM